MATTISKLRKDFYSEQKAKRDMMKDVIIERKKMTSSGVCVSSTLKKMIIDPEKLEKTIQKACQPVQKKCITFLEKPPIASSSEKVLQKNPVPVAVLICQARNLNGTPCKCKAKIGKFCAKHAP